jgi:uncharacterized protein YyaL (SSP411 family)
MARNFLRLGHYYRSNTWVDYARQMIANMYDGMETYGSGYSNWASLLLELNQGFTEVHVLNQSQVAPCLWPENTLLSYHQSLPISAEYLDGIYVCTKGTCHPALSNLEEAHELVKNVGN